MIPTSHAKKKSKKSKKDLSKRPVFSKYSSPHRAEVVELVDTLGSGSSEGNLVGVRLSPSAPREHKG